MSKIFDSLQCVVETEMSDRIQYPGIDQ